MSLNMLDQPGFWQLAARAAQTMAQAERKQDFAPEADEIQPGIVFEICAAGVDAATDDEPARQAVGSGARDLREVTRAERKLEGGRFRGGQSVQVIDHPGEPKHLVPQR